MLMFIDHSIISATKMSLNRSAGRNVFFYDASSPDIALGGLFQNGCVSEANFLQMLSIVLLLNNPIRVQHRISGEIVPYSNVVLAPGDYDIYSNGMLWLAWHDLYVYSTDFGKLPVQVSNEAFIQRLISHSISGSENRFRDTIRHRDRRCVISGVRHSDFALASGEWTAFEAAHIFPVEKESISNLSRWITDPGVQPDSTKIHSPQNGILLLSHIHKHFDQYLISINPDVSYLIMSNDSPHTKLPLRTTIK